MKKFIFTIVALVLGLSQMSAQSLVFEDVNLPLGGKATLTIKYETGGESLTTASFILDLPDGVSSEKTASGKSNLVVNADMEATFVAYTTENDGYSVAAKETGAEFPGTSGVLGTITLIADADAANLVVGESYPVKVSGLSLVKRSDKGLISVPLADMTFNVKITDTWILDENSTAVPPASDGEVNVLVKRTIVANQWSTICLPFDMTKEQVSAAFKDAKFAAFVGYTVDGATPTKTVVEDASSIEISFEADDMSEGYPANSPYLIKTTEDISEFSVVGVAINSDEDAADIEYSTGSNARKVTHGHFYGTLRAGQVIPANDLFLNNNKFYYSTGKTKIKGFRGYFELKDLTSAISSTASVKIYVDGEPTSIDGMNIKYAIDGVYDLSGRKIKLEDGDVTKLQKGVYIIDGKKVTIK